jgi:hypothetical protein
LGNLFANGFVIADSMSRSGVSYGIETCWVGLWTCMSIHNIQRYLQKPELDGYADQSGC